MNKVMLTGYLACEPEIKKTEDGTARCYFRLAVPRDYKNTKTGNRDADFIGVTAWRSLAEICGKYLTKGKKIGLVGRLSARSYGDAEGRKHYITEVVADSVEFLSPNGTAASADDGQVTEFRDDAGDYGYIPGEDAQLPF